jgi:hypothetical protein
MRSSLQETLLVALASVLKPIAKLMLHSGVGYSEFCGVAKSVFVAVASEEYGLRGRPTNMSRVSAITGISRKEVSRLRQGGPLEKRTPILQTNPANTVLHHWHHDREYRLAPGLPKPLPFDGPGSFSTLVGRYAGDIPPGAMKASLRQAGTISEDDAGLLLPRHRFFVPAQLDERVIRGMLFSLSNLGSTVAHNTDLRRVRDSSDGFDPASLFLERAAWTNHIALPAKSDFRDWVREEGTRFINLADSRLGEHELPRSAWSDADQRLVGVGIYYFEE